MVTLYRAGYIPTIWDINHPTAIEFDEISRKYGLMLDGCSPRTDSIYCCVSFADAEKWENWRIETLETDADIWAITIPDNVNVYAHNVKLFEDLRFATFGCSKEEAEQKRIALVREYWETRVLVTETMEPLVGSWEVLLPLEVMLDSSSWNKIKENNWWGNYEEVEVS